MYDKEARQLRQNLLARCEIAEVSLFEDKLFSMADHETCILIGRRKSGKPHVSSVMYRRVRNRDMEEFKSSLEFSREDVLKPSVIGRGEETSLYEPDLRGLWAHTANMPRLEACFDVQKGFELNPGAVLRSTGTVSKTPRAGFTRAVLNASDEYNVWELPKPEWVDLRPANVRRLGAATTLGKAQVIINYGGPRNAWRFKPVLDREGIALSSRFLAFRLFPSSKHSLVSLWSVLLSPVANAYAYSWLGKGQTLVREWLAMPLPFPTTEQRSDIEAAALAYLKLAVPPQAFTLTPPDEVAIKRALLNLDATVLRLYNLPPSLERQLLTIFDRVERPRPGVGCTFRGYPPAWSSRPAEPSLKFPQDDRPVWERIASFAAALPEEVIADLPKDGASQLDHYLYGAPKRNP